MVTFPQSKLGYAVDGRIEFVPNRCHDESKVKYKESPMHKKKIQRDHRMGTAKGFNSEMHSSQSLRSIVNKTPWSNMLPKNTTTARVSKSKLKPRLEFDEPLFHCQEEYDLYCVQPYYWDDPDEYHGIEYEGNLSDSSPINNDEQFAIPESRKVSSDADTYILTCDPREATEDVLDPNAIVFCLDDEIEGDDTIRLDSINAITTTDGDDWSLVSDNSSMSEEEHSFVNVDFI
jgi:hypothetical protein